MKRLFLSVLTASSIGYAQENPQTTLAEANNDLALKLVKQLSKEGENLCISPYSIQSALSMTALGAAGQTHAEMASALSHPKDDLKAIHTAFEVYQDQLSKRLGDAEKSKVTLKVANRLFIDKGAELHGSFKDATKKHYGSSVLQMDFQNKPDQQREKINAWVSDNTEDRIKDLLPKGSVTSDTALVITNATYFKAEWKYPFKASWTHKREFFQQNGKTSKVDFMSQSEHLGYADKENYQVVALPYGKEKPMQFTIILPKQGSKLKDVIQGLTVDDLNELKSLRSYKVQLRLPKFEQKGNTVSLKSAMESLGMKSVFTRSGADLSKISSTRLFVSDIFHQTFIKIDEKGGEAAAATAAVIEATSEAKPEKPIVINVDRPFFYAIQDSHTGLCLFVGTVNQLK